MHFDELAHSSHLIRSAGVHRATSGTIRRQRVLGLAWNRWLPQCGYNKTPCRVAWRQARAPVVQRAGLFNARPPVTASPARVKTASCAS